MKSDIVLAGYQEMIRITIVIDENYSYEDGLQKRSFSADWDKNHFNSLMACQS